VDEIEMEASWVVGGGGVLGPKVSLIYLGEGRGGGVTWFLLVVNDSFKLHFPFRICFLSGADLDHFFFFFRSGWDFCAVSANLQKVGKIAIFI
jgi:hypothetical protein